MSPCAACRRHVLVGEAACPFCGARTVGLVAKQSWPARMSRAAIFTSTALAMPACGGSKHDPEQTVLVAAAAPDAARDDVGTVAVPGTVDAGAATVASPIDAGSMVPADAPAPPADAAVAAVKPTTGHAKIYGTLRDSNGHAAVGWPIRLFAGGSEFNFGADGTEPRTTITNGKGAWAFTKLPAGDYTVVLEGAASPHSSPHGEPVTVTDRQALRVDGQLSPPRPCCMPYGAPPARRRVV